MARRKNRRQYYHRLSINKMSKLDVHTYDGELGDNYQKLIKWDDQFLPSSPNFNVCMEEIKQYILALADHKLQSIGQKIYNILMQDSQNNYDPSNKIKVEDILPRVWRFYRFNDDSDDKFVFMQQFLDISRGTCPQGRAGARFYQLYHMLINDCQQFFKYKKEEMEKTEKSNEIPENQKQYYESTMYRTILELKK